MNSPILSLNQDKTKGNPVSTLPASPDKDDTRRGQSRSKPERLSEEEYVEAAKQIYTCYENRYRSRERNEGVTDRLAEETARFCVDQKLHGKEFDAKKLQELIRHTAAERRRQGHLRPSEIIPVPRIESEKVDAPSSPPRNPPARHAPRPEETLPSPPKTTDRKAAGRFLPLDAVVTDLEQFRTLIAQMICVQENSTTNLKDAASRFNDDKGGKAGGFAQFHSNAGMKEVLRFYDEDKSAKFRKHFKRYLESIPVEPPASIGFERLWRKTAAEDHASFFNAQMKAFDFGYFSPAWSLLKDRHGASPLAVAIVTESFVTGQASVRIKENISSIEKESKGNPIEFVKRLIALRKEYIQESLAEDSELYLGQMKRVSDMEKLNKLPTKGGKENLYLKGNFPFENGRVTIAGL
jgi:hypothetical protein